MRTQRKVLVVAAVAAAALVAVLFAAPAQAEISGPCSATINGESVADHSTGATGDPIKVKRHSQVPVSMSSAKEISHLRVQIQFAGFGWTVHDEPTTGTSWSKDVNVDKYAKYGVGLYKVSGSSSGSGLSCSGAALVKVEGNPLATVAGGVALGLTVVGALGLALLGFRGGGAWPLAVGPLLGLIGGLGFGVLLQQYALVYPTRAVAIVELAGGVALGLGVPGLRRVLVRGRLPSPGSSGGAPAA